MIALATRLGFDPVRLAFAARTAVMASVALVLAWAIGLEHPQWSAMTVWVASQPLRGQILEKSLFRLAGTLSGTLAGILLIQAMQIHPALLVAGLAVWVGLCTGISHVQRGFVGYGTVLAGYTAAMVSLLDAARPDDVLHLGLDRLATVLLGVAIATLAGLVFTRPGDAGRSLRTRVTTLVADALAGIEAPAALLGRIAAIEDELDSHAAGSLRARQAIRKTRALLIATVPLLLTPGRTTAPEAALAARRLREGDPDAAAAALAGAPVEALADLAAALDGFGGTMDAPLPAPPLHRDWIGAREAMLRAGGAVLLFGAIWQTTGWSAGNFMLLGLSVMISLFSTFENPARMMRWVFVGQLCGAAAMLACRWLVWPHATAEWQLVAMMVPFVLFGSLLVSHRGTGALSFDYNMVFLLLMQPHWPLTGNLPGSLATCAATVAAPLAAWVLYKLVFPTDLRRRTDTLLRMIRNDLAAMATSPAVAAHRAIWRARLFHRALRLVRISESSAIAREEAGRAALDSLTTAQRILRLRRRMEAPVASDSNRRIYRQALLRCGRIASDPTAALAALARAEARLDAEAAAG